MDVSQIKQNTAEMFNVIKHAQAVKNDTSNTLIKLSISEKVSGGKSPYSGQNIDTTS